MAQKVQVLLLSDLSGEEAQETINFGLDGSQYEIELTGKEAASLRKSLGKYVEAGRKVTGRRTAKRAVTASSGPDTKVVREWARANGFQVTDRGRVPNEIIEKFNAAH